MPGQQAQANDPKLLKQVLESQFHEERQAKRIKQLEAKATQRSANRAQKQARLDSDADRAWAEHSEKSKRMEIHGFDNFVSAMMSILEISKQLEKALRASRNSILHKYVGGKIFDMLEGMYEQWKLNGEPADVKLPKLNTQVEFDEDSQLKMDSFVDNMTRSDGKELSAEEKGFIADTFKTQVLLHWLEQIGDGYELVDPTNPTTKIVSKIDGKEMSKEAFERYRDGKVPGVKGLNEFLSSAYDLEFEAPEEVPGMRLGR